MANLTNVLLILLALYISALMISGTNIDDSNSLFKFLINPLSSDWESIKGWLLLGGIVGVTVGGAAIIGGIIFKNDALIYGPLFILFLGLAVPPLTYYYTEITTTFNQWVAWLIIGPTFLLYIITCIQWLRTGR